MKTILVFVFSNVLILYWCTCNAQDPPNILPSAPIFTLDVNTYEITGTLPFDKTFKLMLKGVDSTVKSIQVGIYTGLDNTKGTEIETKQMDISNPKNISIPFSKGLSSNKDYHFRIDLMDAKKTVITKVTYGFTLKSRLGDYLKLDLGLGYAPNLQAAISHTAVHFYFMPINNDTDLKTIKPLGKNIFLRTSLFVGTSPVMLYSDTEQPISNSTGIGNLIYGVGIRSPFYGVHLKSERNFGWVFLQPLRINIGQMYFKQEDASPVISKMRNKFCFYIGFSYDISIVGVIGPIGKLLKP